MSIQVVGLTGQTGAGKSTAGAYLRSRGYAVIDCDRVARQVTSPGGDCLDALARAFSKEILNRDGSLNRSALGRIVFSDKGELARLNQVIFPFITQEIFRRVTRLAHAGNELVILDAPTLFESGVDRLCGKVISVTAEEQVRLARIRERDRLTEEDALRRMKSQLEESFFLSHSDFIIRNSAGKDVLQQQLSKAAVFLSALRQVHRRNDKEGWKLYGHSGKAWRCRAGAAGAGIGRNLWRKICG